MINLKKIVIPMLTTNCYFLIKGDECIIFDCGGDFEVSTFLKENNLTPKKIFLTHGHYDHIEGVEAVRKIYPSIEVIAFEKEKELLLTPNMNMSYAMTGNEIVLDDVIFGKNNELYDALGYNIKMIHTPGHTSGSCCYYIEDEKVLFSGDTLFRNTYGRYDLPTGSVKDIVNSVGVELMKLPDDTIVYPGHGESTSISYERSNNELCTEETLNWAKNLNA